ncbi:hypothetical protein [Pontibacter saemangeumensis]|uniref:hypothetical protein n=1 Tax=Pontibacter saemangeumensis TaxID=1084525 RepID=UPI0031E9F1AA
MQKTISLEPGTYYHLYTRGNNKETLFRDPDNYVLFLQLACYRCVPPLLVRTP